MSVPIKATYGIDEENKLDLHGKSIQALVLIVWRAHKKVYPKDVLLDLQQNTIYW